jgi:hypothetical protein
MLPTFYPFLPSFIFHAIDIFDVHRIFSPAMAVVMSTCYYSFISGFIALCFDASRTVEKQAQCATGQLQACFSKFPSSLGNLAFLLGLSNT